jgi:hypothetical protein
LLYLRLNLEFMNAKDTSFPQYRKLVNDKVFYKILDDRNFEEIQVMGRIKNYYQFEAKIYPEILKIKDLLELSDESYVMSSEEEWKTLK